MERVGYKIIIVLLLGGTLYGADSLSKEIADLKAQEAAAYTKLVTTMVTNMQLVDDLKEQITSFDEKLEAMPAGSERDQLASARSAILSQLSAVGQQLNYSVPQIHLLAPGAQSWHDFSDDEDAMEA